MKTKSNTQQWPRIRDLPADERRPFTQWLEHQTRPWIEGESDENQDGYYSHDYDRWKKGLPCID